MSQQLPGLTVEDDRRVIVEPDSATKLPDREALWRHFESWEMSGGGKLDFMDVLSDNTARLTFRDPSDAANVESRDHEVSGVRLIVYPYYSQPQKSDDNLYDNKLETAPISEDHPEQGVQQPEDSPQPRDSQLQGDSRLPEDLPEPQQRLRPPALSSPRLSSDILNISSGKVRYMKTFPSQSLQSLVKDFDDVQYAIDAVIVKGNGSDFKKKVNSLKMAVLDIKEEIFEMHKRHVYGFLTSSSGIKELRKVEDRFRCAISVDQGVYSDVTKDGEDDSSVLDTNLKFIQGDIVHLRADVLVHTVEKDLDLSQGSPSIAEAGGDEVKDEYRARYPNGIGYGKIAKTGGGNLSYKEVFHCCLPEYSSDPRLKLLEKVIYKCLYDASVSGYSSIALPALGTGTLGYPPDEVAKKMLTVIFDFICYTSSLKHITVVVGSDNSGVVRTFEKEKIRQHRNSKLCEADVPAVADAGYPVGKFKVHLRHGDISKEHVICIVHFTNSTTPLNIGILSSPLSVACGKDLELQCQLTAAQMKEKGMAMTTAPNIPADIIMHIGVDRFHGNWKDVIKACLKVATENSFTSIAFPEFGTGDGKLPLAKMPKLLVRCLRDIENKKCSLTDISFVSSDATTHALFCSHMEALIARKDIKGLLSGSTSTSDTLPRQTVGAQQSGSVEQVFVNTAKDGEADITVYSENDDVLRRAFKAVEDLCDIRIVARTFEEKRLKSMSPSQIQSVKRSLESMPLDINITWATGMVELEGVDDDVHEVESMLTRITMPAD